MRRRAGKFVKERVEESRVVWYWERMSGLAVRV